MWNTLSSVFPLGSATVEQGQNEDPGITDLLEPPAQQNVAGWIPPKFDGGHMSPLVEANKAVLSAFLDLQHQLNRPGRPTQRQILMHEDLTLALTTFIKELLIRHEKSVKLDQTTTDSDEESFAQSEVKVRTDPTLAKRSEDERVNLNRTLQNTHSQLADSRKRNDVPELESGWDGSRELLKPTKFSEDERDVLVKANRDLAEQVKMLQEGTALQPREDRSRAAQLENEKLELAQELSMLRKEAERRAGEMSSELEQLRYGNKEFINRLTTMWKLEEENEKLSKQVAALQAGEDAPDMEAFKQPESKPAPQLSTNPREAIRLWSNKWLAQAEEIHQLKSKLSSIGGDPTTSDPNGKAHRRALKQSKGQANDSDLSGDGQSETDHQDFQPRLDEVAESEAWVEALETELAAIRSLNAELVGEIHSKEREIDRQKFDLTRATRALAALDQGGDVLFLQQDIHHWLDEAQHQSLELECDLERLEKQAKGDEVSATASNTEQHAQQALLQELHQLASQDAQSLNTSARTASSLLDREFATDWDRLDKELSRHQGVGSRPVSRAGVSSWFNNTPFQPGSRPISVWANSMSRLGSRPGSAYPQSFRNGPTSQPSSHTPNQEHSQNPSADATSDLIQLWQGSADRRSFYEYLPHNINAENIRFSPERLPTAATYQVGMSSRDFANKAREELSRTKLWVDELEINSCACEPDPEDVTGIRQIRALALDPPAVDQGSQTISAGPKVAHVNTQTPAATESLAPAKSAPQVPGQVMLGTQAVTTPVEAIKLDRTTHASSGTSVADRSVASIPTMAVELPASAPETARDQPRLPQAAPSRVVAAAAMFEQKFDQESSLSLKSAVDRSSGTRLNGKLHPSGPGTPSKPVTSKTQLSFSRSTALTKAMQKASAPKPDEGRDRRAVVEESRPESQTQEILPALAYQEPSSPRRMVKLTDATVQTSLDMEVKASNSREAGLDTMKEASLSPDHSTFDWNTHEDTGLPTSRFYTEPWRSSVLPGGEWVAATPILFPEIDQKTSILTRTSYEKPLDLEIQDPEDFARTASPSPDEKDAAMLPDTELGLDSDGEDQRAENHEDQESSSSDLYWHAAGGMKYSPSRSASIDEFETAAESIANDLRTLSDRDNQMEGKMTIVQVVYAVSTSPVSPEDAAQAHNQLPEHNSRPVSELQEKDSHGSGPVHRAELEASEFSKRPEERKSTSPHTLEDSELELPESVERPFPLFAGEIVDTPHPLRIRPRTFMLPATQSSVVLPSDSSVATEDELGGPATAGNRHKSYYLAETLATLEGRRPPRLAAADATSLVRIEPDSPLMGDFTKLRQLAALAPLNIPSIIDSGIQLRSPTPQSDGESSSSDSMVSDVDPEDRWENAYTRAPEQRRSLKRKTHHRSMRIAISPKTRLAGFSEWHRRGSSEVEGQHGSIPELPVTLDNSEENFHTDAIDVLVFKTALNNTLIEPKSLITNHLPALRTFVQELPKLDWQTIWRIIRWVIFLTILIANLGLAITLRDEIDSWRSVNMSSRKRAFVIGAREGYWGNSWWALLEFLSVGSSGGGLGELGTLLV